MNQNRIHRWAIAVFFYCCGLSFASWASRIPTIKDKFNLNEAELGALLFMLPFGSLVALPIAGWSINRFGSRTMTFLSTVLYALLLLLLALSPSVTVLSIVLFFFGFWGDVLNIAVNTQALVLQENYYKKSLLSSFHGMWSLGALSGAFWGGLFMKAGASANTHFLTIAILCILLSILCLFSLIPHDHLKEKSDKIFAWPNKSLVILGAICFCCAICEGAMADWSSLYYKQVLKDLSRVSTTGYTSFALLMATGRMVGDRLTSHMGYKGILVFDSLLVAGGLALAIGIQTPLWVIIGFGMVGFGVATIIPIVYSLAGRSKTMPASSALAAVSTLGFTGFLVGPPVIGLAAHEVGLRWALTIVMGMALFVLFLSRKLRT